MTKFVVRGSINGETFQETIEADYWIQRDHHLILLSKKGSGNQYDTRVAAFAPGFWYVITREEELDTVEPAGDKETPA